MLSLTRVTALAVSISSPKQHASKKHRQHLVSPLKNRISSAFTCSFFSNSSFTVTLSRRTVTRWKRKRAQNTVGERTRDISSCTTNTVLRDGKRALFFTGFVFCIYIFSFLIIFFYLNTIRKHTQRAAWRGVAASRMADWRRTDDSRSVSVLGRGRGDRWWLVTRAGGCPPEG